MTEQAVVILMDKFLRTVEEDVKNGVPLDPTQWIERAMKINAVMNSLIDRISQLDIIVALARRDLVVGLDEQGKPMTSAKAKIICDAMPEYQESARLQAKKKQAEEFIRLCKRRATMDSDTYLNQ